MEQGARRYLAECLTGASVAPPRIDVDVWRQQTLRAFLAALEALRAVEAVSVDEVHGWTNRMLIRLGIEPLPPQPPGEGSRAVLVGTRSGAPARTRRPPARFVALLPARQPDRPIPFGGRVQILGIEQYDTQVAIAWRVAPLPDQELRFADELRVHERDTEGLPEHDRQHLRRRLLLRLDRPGHELQLGDDLGTAYRRLGGSSGTHENDQVGRALFEPGIPARAAQVHVRWGSEVFDVALEAGAG